MTHQNQTSPAAAAAQIRVTVETLDHKGRVQRKAVLAHDFPAWAQGRAIERCLGATSVTAGALLTRVLPVLQVGTGADVTVLDPLDYSAITHEQLTPQDQVQRIFTSPLGVEFSRRSAELGIKSLNVDEDTPESYLDLIGEMFATWKRLVRVSDSASLSGERQAELRRRSTRALAIQGRHKLEMPSRCSRYQSRGGPNAFGGNVTLAARATWAGIRKRLRGPRSPFVT